MRSLFIVIGMLLLSPLLAILAVARRVDRVLTESDNYQKRSRAAAEAEPLYTISDPFAETEQEIRLAKARERESYNALRDDV